MAKKQKTAFLQDLDTIQAYEIEEGLLSKYFNITDLPLELPMGKSSMLIMGSPELLNDVVLKIELVDSLGNPIYIEPVYDYSESNGVRVGIEVFKDTPAGAATLTILGELDPDYVDIPEQWQGTYNVKYTRTITVNKTIPNDRPVRFYKRPVLNVYEIIKGQVTQQSSTTGSNEQTVGTIVGTPVQGTEGTNFSIDGDNYQEVQNYSEQVYGFNPMGNYEEYDSTDPRYSITIADADFSSSMVGGTITIDAPNPNISFSTGSNTIIPGYSSRISNVINKKTIEVQKPFGVYDSGSGFYRVAELGTSSYKINWPKLSEYDTSSINFKSFADVRLSKLRLFSGDVYRVAGYVKNNGPFGNWSKIIDTPIETPELLVDPTSTSGTSRMGFFSSDAVLTSYWTATGGQYGTESATTIQTYSPNEYLTDSIYISGSNADLLIDDDKEWIKLQLKDDFKMDFIAGTEYSFRAKLIADNSEGLQNKIKAVLHMSGSAFGMSQNNTFADKGYGRAIGKVEFNDSAGRVVGASSPQYETIFTPDSDGAAVLQMRFTGGHWSVSEISVKPNSDTNFSPEYVRLIAPIPPLQTRPDYLDFAFEFYDINNNKSSTVVTTLPSNPDGVKFEGENLNILGNDNSIGGSLFIGGDATSSGIQMGGVSSTLPETGGSGADGSGFIRSVQYQGFKSSSLSNNNTGWMIYSGSVLPDSGDDYAGVGLELAGESGSLRFSTIPSRFEVIADAFFVGTTTSQFISGSSGNIEISSSDFHLTPKGNVTASNMILGSKGDGQYLQYVGNTLTVQGDITANNIRTPATIGGQPSTDANASASIDTQGFASFKSASIAGFTIDPTSIISSDSSLLLRSSGQMTGSSILLGNKSAGHYLQYVGNTLTVQGDITANNIRTPASIGGSPSTVSNASASIDPQGFASFKSASIGGFEVSDSQINSTNDNLILKDSGQITASAALIQGASTIAGFSVSDSQINSTNNNLILKSTGQITASAVSMSGAVSATSGQIAGWKILGNKLSGSNATLDAEGAALYKSDAGPDTNPTDGYYLDFTPSNSNPYYVRFGSNFAVSSSGQLIASGAKIEGVLTSSEGNIANWNIQSDTIHYFTDPTYTGLSSAGDSRFFAGATSLAASSSAPFNVKASGQLTASSANIQGDITANTITANTAGTIANFNIDSAEIKSSNSNLRLKADGQITASNAQIIGKVTATSGQIAGFDINGTKLQQGSSFYLEGNASSQYFISSSKFQVTPEGEITGSNVLFSGGRIGGFDIGTSYLRDTDNTVELSSILPGLKIKDDGGVSRVEIKSGSLSTLGGGTQYCGNKSFEEQLGDLSAGRNFVSTINSWSFAEGGGVNISLTKRSAYPSEDMAVSGDVTLDVVVPEGSGNYSGNNTYELVQVVTSSVAIAAGDTLSFASVARYSSSFGGKGKDRALGPQYFRVEYSSSAGWVPFLPEAKFTASNGYGEYFLGSGQYSSFGASAEIPATATHLKLVLTGSINDDTGFQIEKPLFVGDKGSVNSDLHGRTFTKTVVGSSTAEYPETEITFDNFSIRSNTRKVELTQEGLLIYNSEDSFFKMSGAGIEFRGGSGLATFGSSISREQFTNDSQIAGSLGAPALQAYIADPEGIGTVSSDGNVAEYAKGNHRHILPFATINSVLSGQTITNGTWNSGLGSNAGALMDSELTSIADVKALDQSVISGASPTFGTANFTDASNKRLMTDAQEALLDSVESGATADQSAAEILTAIKTVDGALSALDADLLDGQHGSYYIDRGNHTGTQAASTISDFDTEVANNTAVAANTAKVTNVSTNLSVSRDSTKLDIVSSDGTNAVLPLADSSNWGVMSDEMFDKLDALQPGLSSATISGSWQGELSSSAITYIGGGVSGSLTSTGSFGHVIADGNIEVSQYIYHKGDDNTYLNFTPDRLRFNIGGISYIDLNDSSGAPHDITFNDGGNNVDVTIKGSSNNPLFKTDASANRIGTHGLGTPAVAFHIGGSELRVDGTISGSNYGGNVSGSSTSTGSFGKVFGDGSSLTGVTSYTDSDTLVFINSQGIFSGSAQIDHDATTNFAANEHFTQANITTVGTIGTGTWQGTAINQTYLVGQSGTNTGDTSITDSTSTTSSTTRASATGVKAAYDRGSTGITNAAAAQSTADSAVQPADTFYIGTTSIAHNRGSGDLTLAGLILTTPTIAAAGWVNANHTHAGSTTGGQIAASAVSDFDTEVSNNTTVVSAYNSGATRYTHPTNLAGDDIGIDTGALTGATVISDLDFNVTTDTAGHVTDANGSIATRTLTLADLGYTGTIDANTYVHPTDLAGDDIGIDTGALTGAVVISDLDFNVTTNTAGHVTDANGTVATRTLTLADLGYTGTTDANTYVHPTSYSGDDFSVDTGALTGATVVSDIDVNITTDTAGHVTDANGAISTRTLTLANLGYTGETDATADQTAAEILTAIKTVDGAGSGLDADLLDGQTGTYYTDFSNITVTSGEVSNTMLANSSINFGGISLSLGGSDTTPAFALADATGLPIVAGTTGTLSVARGGTGVTTSTGTGNTVLSASPTFTGTATSAIFRATSRIVSADNMFMAGGQFYLGAEDSSTNDTYRMYGYDAGKFILQSRESGTWTTRFEISSTGNITIGGTVDGRDLSTDGSKLDGIETSAKDDQTITAGTGLTGGGTGDVTLNVIGGTGITANANDITTTDSEIVHDNLSGFIANEHIDHSAVSITAGGILSGGGTIASNRTITLASSDVVHDSTTGFVANEHIDHSAVSISAGGILSGGGTIASNRTITLASSDVVHDSTTGFVANEHIDHSGVEIIAGSGLSGGGTIASSRTINIGGGSGIDVSTNTISVDVSDFMTNGSDNRVLTATGADAMNAEANLTFDGTILSGSAQSTGSFGHVKIPDDGMLSIGSSNDLQIYHNGSHTHIAETGTGNLILRSSAFQVKNAANDEVMIQANEDGAVTLYYDNTQRLVTTVGGINITGDITGSGDLKIGGNIITNTSTNYAKLRGHNGGLQIKNSASGYAGISAIDSGGTFRFTVYGDTNGYGFLNSAWGGWDLRKDVGGKLYTGTGTTYYVQPDSLSHFSTFSTTGTATFGGTVTAVDGIFTGNLSVAGTMTTTTTNEVVLGDQILTLNGGSSAGDGGIYVNDAATTQTGSLLWDVSEDRWIGGLKDSEINLVTISSDDTLTNKTLTSPDINGGTWNGTVDGNSTAAGITWADLGSVTTIDINGGDIASGVTINKSPVVNFNSGDVQGQITLTNLASGTGGLTIQATSVEGSMLNDNVISGQGALGSATVAQADLFLMDDGPGTLKKVTFANLEDSLWNNITGDVLINSSGLATIQENSVALTTDTTGNYVQKIVSSTGLSGGVDSEGATATLSVDYGTSAGTAAEGDNTLTLTGASNEITIDAGSGANAIGSDTAITIGLADTIGGARTFSDTATFNEDIVLSGTGDSIYNSYISGIMGSGWKLDYDTSNGGSSLEIDNITVRNTLQTHIFQKDVVKATNGYLYVSDSGVISGSDNNFVYFEDEKSATFASASRLWFKSADITGSGTINSVKFSILSASFDTNQSGVTKYTVDNIEGDLANLTVGGTAVRISGGSLLLDASSTHSPFMDVISGSNDGAAQSVVTRTGRLTGITSGRFGELAGYGFWASGSAYLEGTINATSGNIGGWGIGATAISSSDGIIDIDAGAKRITITDGTNDRVHLGEIDSAYGLKIFNDSGAGDANLLVELGSEQNMIAGWDLVPGKFQYDNEAGSIALDATNKQVAIYTGSIDTAKPKVVMGNLPTTGTAKYGFAVFSGSANADINSDSTYSVLITKDEARLAGWDMSPGKLTSGTVARIDGNTATIALGTNATTHTTSSPSASLFFVSASSNPIFFVGENFSYVDDVLTAGGWKIGKGQISSSNGNAILSGSGVLSLGSGTHGYGQANRTYIDGPGNRMSIGEHFAYTGGTLSVSGWTVGSGLISGTNARLRSAGVLSLGSADGWDTANCIYIDGTNTRMSLGTGFTYTGNALTIDGNATIAGWTINSTTITSTNTILGLGYISLGSGTSAYNSANRIYIDGNNTRMSMGTGFRYTSNALTIDGNATIAGWTIDANSLTKGKTKISAVDDASYFAIQASFGWENPGFWVGQTSSTAVKLSLSGSNGGMFWNNTRLRVKGADGSTVFKTTTTGAEIGGWTVGTDKIYTGTNETVAGYTSAAGRLIISSSGAIHSKEFYVDAAGNASFAGALSSGISVSAPVITGGTVSGATVAAGSKTAFASGNGVGVFLSSDGIALGNLNPFVVTAAGALTATGVNVTGDITADTITANTSGEIGGFGITPSEISSSNASGNTGLRLKASGQITASAAKITGNITATGGTIGNWIVGTKLTSNNMTLDPSLPAIYMGDKESLLDNNDGIYIGAAANTPGGFAISVGTDEDFFVNSEGQVTASAAKITGDITATKGTFTNVTVSTGTIGGFTIGTNLTNGSKAAWNDANSGIFIGSTGIGLGPVSTGFSVSAAGALTATGVDITGAISATSGDFSGTVNIGSTSNNRIQLVGTGVSTTTLIKQESDRFTIRGDGYASFSSGQVVFNADGSGTIGSTISWTTSGVLSVGKITATAGSVGGFVIDGHSLTATGVEINDATQALFISSSAFKVDHTGNITASNVALSGDITATSGAVGGFTIANTHITGSGGKIVSRNKETDNFGTGQTYDVTKRTEIHPESFIVRYSDGDPTANNTGFFASRIVAQMPHSDTWSYFQGETLAYQSNSSIRSEGIQFGQWDSNDSFTSGNLYIGKGGRTNASIRSGVSDSDPGSCIYPDTSNSGWSIGDKLAVQNIIPGGGTTISKPAYRFSVVGDTSFYGDHNITGSLGVNVAPNATAGTGYFSNNIVAYASDKRLKENIKSIKNPVEKVLGLEGVTFNWNELAEKEVGYDRQEGQVGLLAQDLQKVLPEAVKIAPFDSDPSGSSISGEKYLTIQYERVVPLLVESIKEMGSLIGDLESRIKQLESKE